MQRISRSEREALEAAITACEPAPFVEKLRTLLDKLQPGRTVSTKVGVAVAPIEAALVASADGKVAPTKGAPPSFWIIVGRTLTEAGATPEDATILGTWLSKQAWLTGALTIMSVARKWPDWMARARAEVQQQGSTDAWEAPEFGDG